MNEQTHCQSCGAPIQIGECKCPYCDTPYPLSNIYAAIHIKESKVDERRRKARRGIYLVPNEYGIFSPNEIRVEYDMEAMKNALRTEQLYADALEVKREYSIE